MAVCLPNGVSRHQMDQEADEYVELPTKIRASMALFKNLAQTLQKQQYCDLIFELTGSIKFHTHRLVVALWSPVMMKMLNQSSCRVEKVVVKSNLQDAFKQFIHFLYTGTFDGNVTDVHGVLLLASTFQIPLLRSLCEEHLHQTMCVDNVIGLFHTSVKFHLSCLEWQCVDHIRQHLPDVAQNTELKELTPEQFNTFLASQHVSKLKPEMKLFLIISWLTEQVPDRQHFLVLLLGHIDWSTVAQDFLTEIRQTDNFFTSHPSSLYLLLQTLHSASISLGPYEDRFDELRKEHSDILNTVVSGSMQIGTGRQEVFQPIPLTVISGPSRDRLEPTRPLSNINNASGVAAKKVKAVAKPTATDKLDGLIYNTSNNGSRPSREVVKKKVESPSTAVDSKSKASSGSSSSSQSKSEAVVTAGEQSNQTSGGDKRPSLYRTAKTAIESGSMRRKTLRPRKVVSNDSVSIVSTKSASSRRTVAALPQSAQRGGKDSPIIANGSAASTATSVKFEVVVSPAVANPRGAAHVDYCKMEEEEDDDQGESVVDAEDGIDEEEEEEEENVSKKQRKIKVKIGKVKMGRPRKGYERNKFSCTQCEYVTRHSHLLDKHTRQVHESKRIIKCPICEFQCNWSKTLYLHVKADHYNNTGPPFLCDIQACSYTVDKMNKLVEHRRSHTGDRPFMCDECKMSFRSKSNLYAHLKCHNDAKQFECPICSRCFKMKITLDQHLVVHKDLRQYLCDLCGFATKYHSHLVAHRRKHTGDVFPCTFPACTYTTPKKSTLQAHMRSHLGIRQHVCDICGKAFIEKSHLVRHKRIHTTDKQHKCTQCDYASHRQDKLREHMQKHEKEANRINNPPNPDTAGKSAPKPTKKRRRRKKPDVAVEASKRLQDSSSTSITTATTSDPSPHLAVPEVSHDHTMASPSDQGGLGTHYEVTPGPPPPRHHQTGGTLHHQQHLKQEKDWGELELLARMGFTVAEGGQGQAAAEFSDIFSRGFDPSSSSTTAMPADNNNGGGSSLAINHPPPLPPSSSVHHHHHHQVPAEPQSRSDATASSFSTGAPSHSHRASSHSSSSSSSGKNPHPLVMIPNMSTQQQQQPSSSSSLSPHSQQQHQQHHHQQPYHLQQPHHHHSHHHHQPPPEDLHYHHPQHQYPSSRPQQHPPPSTTTMPQQQQVTPNSQRSDNFLPYPEYNNPY